LKSLTIEDSRNSGKIKLTGTRTGNLRKNFQMWVKTKMPSKLDKK
jgi:hypothetical protein